MRAPEQERSCASVVPRSAFFTRGIELPRAAHFWTQTVVAPIPVALFVQRAHQLRLAFLYGACVAFRQQPNDFHFTKHMQKNLHSI
ncbi:MAG: hypothetical protein EAZ24_01910 [Burkholderiales bacterium]|nr:MAG: hypothetical protein EAZ21_10560 [Betaproteobacteria bacterium]TAG84146.1 MAG: hypothetical protein EAZ24_01910 [Burkholderiales bacterium]